ncbi:MAG: hypothetical protein AB8H80_22790 [Planctomycetota bacterium]
MNYEASKRDTAVTTAAAVREPRPFLYLKPAALPLVHHEYDAAGVARLQQSADADIPHIVRSIVDYTIASQNERSRRAQPIPMSVLNRRRRAARSWLRAILEARCDAATRHAVATQWLPILCGTGPDRQQLAPLAAALCEFVRGVVTASVFVEPKANLLGDARALHALESTLSVHLAAVGQLVRPSASQPASGRRRSATPARI